MPRKIAALVSDLDQNEEQLKRDFKLGTKVIVHRRIEGTVRYIGAVDWDEDEDIWLGLELEKPVGKNDGTVDGKTYFTCLKGADTDEEFGFFIRANPKKVKVVSPHVESLTASTNNELNCENTPQLPLVSEPQMERERKEEDIDYKHEIHCLSRKLKKLIIPLGSKMNHRKNMERRAREDRKLELQSKRMSKLEEEEKFLTKANKTFEKLDIDHSGTISVDELHKACDILQVKCTHAELKESVRLIDKNGDGEVDISEFICFLNFVKFLVANEENHEMDLAYIRYNNVYKETSCIAESLKLFFGFLGLKNGKHMRLNMEKSGKLVACQDREVCEHKFGSILFGYFSDLFASISVFFFISVFCSYALPRKHSLI